MKIIALTGGIACGKTTLANMLRDLGPPVRDADAISRRLPAPAARARRHRPVRPGCRSGSPADRRIRRPGNLGVLRPADRQLPGHVHSRGAPGLSIRSSHKYIPRRVCAGGYI